MYHDLGNLNYSFITDAGEDKLTFKRFTGPIVEALKGLGLDAEASGRNDILVNGRKVSGTAQRIFKNRILHHGTPHWKYTGFFAEGYGTLGILGVFERIPCGERHCLYWPDERGTG